MRNLAGNGALLVRERALASRVQGALERMYRIDRVADVSDFIDEAPTGQREALVLRGAFDGDFELSVRLPALEDHEQKLDALCQIIEGVSHFIYVVDRINSERETTQLELELQAEVDKWIVLAASMRVFDAAKSEYLRARLYETVSFAHEPDSELGARYRLANEAANQFVWRLERDCVRPRRFSELHARLRLFFALGQEEKLRMGREL